MANISNSMQRVFSNYGLSRQKIEQILGQDRMFADLGIYGEDFYVFSICLREEFGDNLPSVEHLVPSEFSLAAHLFSYSAFIPLLRRIIRGPDITVTELERYLEIK